MNDAARRRRQEERFADVWNRSTSLGQVASVMCKSKNVCKILAVRLRKCGYVLKKFEAGQKAGEMHYLPTLKEFEKRRLEIRGRVGLPFVEWR